MTKTLRALASIADGELVLALDRTLYPAEHLAVARAAFAGHCEVTTNEACTNSIEVRIRLLSTESEVPRDVLGSFLNYLLGLAVTGSHDPLPVR
jgi:hypothetical protein